MKRAILAREAGYTFVKDGGGTAEYTPGFRVVIQ